MSINYTRPTGVNTIQGSFSSTEVGLTHPFNTDYIKLADNGDIYIMANESLGIIISASKQSIILVGDVVKLFTNEDEGFKWNDLAFNPKATKYSEPTFVVPREPVTTLYDDITDYLEDD